MTLKIDTDHFEGFGSGLGGRRGVGYLYPAEMAYYLGVINGIIAYSLLGSILNYEALGVNKALLIEPKFFPAHDIFSSRTSGCVCPTGAEP